MQKNIASQKSQNRKSKKARQHNDQKKTDKLRSKQTLHRNLKIEQHEPN